MIPIETVEKIPKLYNWYSKMSPENRIQFIYIVLLVASWTILYFNDSQHKANNAALTIGINRVNDLRSKDQERYTTNLEFYTNKFADIFERQLEQKEEIKQIKEDK